MKRLKTIFACLLMAVLSIGQVWATEYTATYTVTSASSVSESGDTPDGSSATLTGNAGLNSGMLQLTYGKNAVLTISGYEGCTITGFKMSMKSNSSKGKGSMTLVAGETTLHSVPDAAFNTSDWYGSWSTSAVDVDFTSVMTTDYTVDEDENIVITVTNHGTSNSTNSLYIGSYTITYEVSSSGGSTPSLSVSPTSWDFGEVAVSDEASKVFSVSGSNLTAGTLSISVPAGFSVSPSSISVTEATLAATNVTVSKNTTTIDDYSGNLSLSGCGLAEAKTVALEMSVVADPEPTGTFEIFSGDLVEGDYVLVFATRNNAMKASQTLNANRLDYAVVSPSENKLVNPDAALVWHIAPISETANWTIYNADAEKYAASTNAKNQATLADGDLTENMEWAVTVSAGKYDFENIARSSGTDPNNKWLRNNDDGTNHYGFACYASGTGTALTLYKKSDGKPAAPTFSPAGGSYLDAQSVTISADAGVDEIRYTLDESTPTASSTLYSGAIPVSSTTTIKAIAIKDAVEGHVATATYTIINTEHAGTDEDPYSVADAKAVIDGIGTKEDAYVSGIISQVDSYNSTYKSITYWISADGTTSGQQLQVYSGKGIEGADFSGVEDVVVKATVVVKGTLKMQGSIYEFNYNNELVSYVAPVEPIVTLKQSGSTVTSLNLDATGVATQAIDIVCGNFADAISSVSAKLYEESTCETEITSGAWVTDITVNGAKDQVTFNVADNAGEARQVWMKVVASDGTNEAYAVLAISQAKFTVDYAELPFEFDGGKNDVANTYGMTHSGLGSDYSASPKLKFDGTGDWLIIKINEAPGTLTYNIKNNGFSGGTFTVQESEDGVDYTNVEEYTTIEDTQNESKELAQNTRYIKFIYTEKASGNVGLGNIGITAYVAPAVKPTITTQPEGAEYTQGDTPDALTIVAEAANGGALSYQWYSNNENSIEGADAIVGADEAEYTPSTEELGTIYYYCVVTEADADEPTTSNIVAIAVSEAPEPTGTFELFSGDLVEGDYVIYYGDGAMNTTVSSNRLQYVEVTPSNNKITDPDASIIWHIAANGDYWTLYNAAYNSNEGAYAASTSSKNQATMADGELTDNMRWSVTASAGTYDFENLARSTGSDSGNKWLRKNGTYGFACYSSSQSGTGPLTLYKKKIEGQPATPTFTVAGGTFTSAQTVGIECATEDVTIHYTLDGTAPTSESAVYSTALEISSTKTVKAIAIKNEIVSEVASATYTIVTIEHDGTENDHYTVTDARNAIDVYGELSDKYVAGIISQVDSYNSNYKSITYWISADGETTSPQLKVYSGKGIDGADFSSKDDLQVGDIVVVKGTLKLYESTYEFDYDNELVSLDKPAVPTVTLKQSGSIVTALNVEATSVPNQEIDIECANFASAISSVTAKLYEESTCETEITSDAWVTDITVNVAKLTFNIADNTGTARQVWMKVTATDDTDEASAVLAISQTKLPYATLPFAFNGGKADIATACGMTQSGLGSDYASAPKLKFDNTGDWLIIRINEAPGKLTYSISNNTFSGGTFTVQESADGESYTNIASHTEIEGTQNEEVDLTSTTRYVKFIYTEKENGNVGLGNINIAKYVEPEPDPQPVVIRDVLTAGKWGTICPKQNILNPAGASFFTLSYGEFIGEKLDKVFFDEIGANESLVAGKPYLFIANGTEITGIKDGDEATQGENDYNGFHGVLADYDLYVAEAYKYYIIYDNEIRLCGTGAEPFVIKAERAYLEVSEIPGYPTQPAPGRRRLVMNVNNGNQMPTEVENVEVSNAPRKVVINGELYIIRGEKRYDVRGQLVK